MNISSHQALNQLLTVILGISFLMLMAVLGAHAASAQGFIPLPSAQEFGDLPDPEGEGLQKGYNLVFEVARNFRYIIGAVAILFMVISGIKMGIMGDDEETANKQKKNLVWGLVGLALIMIAGPLSEILDLQQGGFLSDEYEIGYRAKLFDNQVHIILTFIKYIVGSIAVLFMIRSGALLVTAGDEEVLAAEKKNIIAAVFALFIIIVSDVVVKKVLFKIEAPGAEYSMQGQEAVVTFDTARGIQEIVGITNFVVTWATPVAVLVLIAGAIMYLTAMGDEEKMGKAKKLIVNAIIALVIIYGAFALVSTFVSGVF